MDYYGSLITLTLPLKHYKSTKNIIGSKKRKKKLGRILTKVSKNCLNIYSFIYIYKYIFIITNFKYTNFQQTILAL